MENPGKYFRNNLIHTINLLDAMVAADVKQLVYSSSCATYGIPVSLPIRETHPQHPINPYGESKLSVERAVHWYGVAHGIQAFTLRYFNAAGDDPDGEIGEDHDPETHIIPLAIQTALGLREKLTIFGTEFNTPDGTAIRDYVHVCDLAEAHVKAVENLLAGGKNTVLNLGTGNSYSIRDVIAAVEQVSGLPVKVQEAQNRPGDPPMLVAASDAAAEILNWHPRFSDLHTIVETAFRWHAEHEVKEVRMSPTYAKAAADNIDWPGIHKP